MTNRRNTSTQRTSRSRGDGRRWSARVNRESNALDLENRAGGSLSPERRRVLTQAKAELRKVFGRE